MGFLIITVAVSALQLVSARDYCTIASCNGETHVGCPIPTIPGGPSCSSFMAITYSDSQRNHFVALHNEKRNAVASGKAVSRPNDGANPFYLPSATDMKMLSWDPELALLASYNVRQCKIAHDGCRDTDQFVGQNLYKSWYSGGNAANIPIDTIIDDSINAFYDEINQFDLPQIDSFTGANGVGHFTQLIWADTTKVGCAGGKWLDGNRWNYLVACNYAEAGNILGGKIYTREIAGSVSTAKASSTITPCNEESHAGCPIPNIPGGPSHSWFTQITYSDSQRNHFVALHNEKRNTVASGKAVSRPSDGSGPIYLPSATDMNMLSWNSELAHLASYNVHQCKMAQDGCRNSDQYIGQNLYNSWYSGSNAANISIDTIIDEAINAWYEEINQFDLSQIDSFTEANGVGHFTQLIWADTTEVGCAGAKWLDGNRWNYLVVCTYAGVGNSLGQKIYTRGAEGSACVAKDAFKLLLLNIIYICYRVLK